MSRRAKPTSNTRYFACIWTLFGSSFGCRKHPKSLHGSRASTVRGPATFGKTLLSSLFSHPQQQQVLHSLSPLPSPPWCAASVVQPIRQPSMVASASSFTCPACGAQGFPTLEDAASHCDVIADMVGDTADTEGNAEGDPRFSEISKRFEKIEGYLHKQAQEFKDLVSSQNSQFEALRALLAPSSTGGFESIASRPQGGSRSPVTEPPHTPPPAAAHRRGPDPLRTADPWPSRAFGHYDPAGFVNTAARTNAAAAREEIAARAQAEAPTPPPGIERDEESPASQIRAFRASGRSGISQGGPTNPTNPDTYPGLEELRNLIYSEIRSTIGNSYQQTCWKSNALPAPMQNT